MQHPDKVSLVIDYLLVFEQIMPCESNKSSAVQPRLEIYSLSTRVRDTDGRLDNHSMVASFEGLTSHSNRNRVTEGSAWDDPTDKNERRII